MENLLFLGVPILKHIRVTLYCSSYSSMQAYLISNEYIHLLTMYDIEFNELRISMDLRKPEVSVNRTIPSPNIGQTTTKT